MKMVCDWYVVESLRDWAGVQDGQLPTISLPDTAESQPSGNEGNGLLHQPSSKSPDVGMP